MTRKIYTDEFRQRAVDLYESTPGATLEGIAAEAAEGQWVNRKRVARVMREHGLAGIRLRRYVGDITYMRIADGTNLYLATVIDVCSRKLAGRAIAHRIRRRRHPRCLARTPIAARHRLPLGPRIGLHLEGLRRSLRAPRGDQSIGASADNALAESFNATLKREILAGSAAVGDQSTAYRAVFRWANRSTPVGATPRSATRDRQHQPERLRDRRLHHARGSGIERTDIVSTIMGQGPQEADVWVSRRWRWAARRI